MDIYKITNKVNGLIYIGKTTKNLDERRKAHLNAARNNSSARIHSAMREFGFDNFEFTLLDTADDIDTLNELEIYYINKFNSTDLSIGYNDHEGGDINMMHSDRIREKHSDSMKCEDVRHKISNTLKAYRKDNPFTEEHRKNLSKSMMGNHNFGSGDTRSIGCYCIDENGVRHDFHSYKDGGIWWFDNYKPFGNKYVQCTLQRKIIKSINGELDNPIRWFKLDCVETIEKH